MIGGTMARDAAVARCRRGEQEDSPGVVFCPGEPAEAARSRGSIPVVVW
jgi:hypothetical protein